MPFDPQIPSQIIMAVREKYLKKFIDAVHTDDQYRMDIYYNILDVLTEAYWCVFHQELPK